MKESPIGDEDPLGELPKANPYAPPSVPFDPYGTTTNPVLIPGIILLVLSGLFLLLLLAGIPGHVVRLSRIDTLTPQGLGELTSEIVAIVCWFALTGSILYGSICMIRMKGYSGAFAAAVAALIPCCSPFFFMGIPFGIWALIVLLKPGVRERFQP